MIKRYSSKIMEEIWSEESKFSAMLEIEIKTLEALNKLGIVPLLDLEKIKNKASFNLQRISEIESQTHHDVIAFTRCVSESLQEEKKWIHYGLTSTDVVDTANAIVIKKANEILENDILLLIDELKSKALIYKYTPCIGRTHGIHAELTTFGLKWALYYDEMKRQLERFKRVRKEIEIGKISGAVGNFANTPIFVQDYVCEALKIESARISTQILQRDRHAYYIATLANIAGTLEKIATEIRNLQRTEIHEVEEYFSKNQKGSSAMPHKHNPIASENICGCSRVIRGYMIAAYEDMALWHERDISHSSVERIILPDATTLLDYMLNRLKKVINQLIVHKDKMLENINLTRGIIFSQQVLTQLINKGLSREESYDIVQELANEAYNSKDKYFIDLLKSSLLISKYLNEKEIDKCFDLAKFNKNVDDIYIRVGIEK
ncbi:MAG: adenylosuccinate lyase [Bacilli bacterium]|nr:adenylosuccinate lyase [Bacilli bacterium]